MNYTLLYIFTTLLGVTTVALVFYWILLYREGFGLSDVKQEFNFHPTLMALSLIFLYSQSILLHRTLEGASRRELMIIQGIIHVFASAMVIWGIKAVFDFHDYSNPPIRNLLTLHSWIGMSTVVLYLTQCIIAVAYLCFPQLMRCIIPIHGNFGNAGFILSIMATVTGLTEKIFFMSETKPIDYTEELVVLNCIGALVSLLGILVLYLINATDD